MANFKTVNAAITKKFPDIDVRVTRCADYVYFDGADGFDKIDSLYVHPVSTTTEDLIKFCFESISEVEAGLRVAKAVALQRRGAEWAQVARNSAPVFFEHAVSCQVSAARCYAEARRLMGVEC